MNTTESFLKFVQNALDDPHGIREETYRSMLDALSDYPNVVAVIESKIECTADSDDTLRFFFEEGDVPDLVALYKRGQ